MSRLIFNEEKQIKFHNWIQGLIYNECSES